MVQMIKEFIGKLFNQKKLNPSSVTVYKTRAQLIEEGKSAYLPKRHRHDVPVLKKH